MKRMLLLTLTTALLAYVALCALLFLMQRRLLYFPGSSPAAEQQAFASRANLQPWVDATGTHLGWKREPADAALAEPWLVLHGNAGQAVQRAHWADALATVRPGRTLAIYILEYPGYGGRPGAPSQASLTAAALAAFDAIPISSPARIHLLGESLGCAVAAQLAQARPQRTGGLVLVSPFNRLADVAAHHYPWLPVRWLVKDQWASAAALRDFPGPVAILAAERDHVVPARYAQRLHDDFPGPKRFTLIPGEDHNFFVFDQPWFREAVAFATTPN
jgi:hypothetical protein